MNNLIKISFTLCAIAAAAAAQGAITGEWKLHPTFDQSVEKVIDTPSRCYMMGYNQKLYNTSSNYFAPKTAPDMSLFYFDKEGNEMVTAAQRHPLNGNAVRFAEYNPDKKYLFIDYDDHNFDLLYDDGKVRNISALKYASVTGAKDLNFVSFDSTDNLIWVATSFGYLALDENKLEVAESRNLGTSVSCVARQGDYVYFIVNGTTYRSHFASARYSLSDMEPVSALAGVTAIYPLGNNRMLLSIPQEENTTLLRVVDPTAGYSVVFDQPLDYLYSVLPGENGFVAMNYNNCVYFKRDSDTPGYVRRPEEDFGVPTSATWKQGDFYTAKARRGIKIWRRDASGSFYTIMDYSRPNAPAPYLSRAMAVHPRYGMLVNNHGSDPAINYSALVEPILLSSLKDGLWTPLAPAYRYASQANVGYNPLGLLVDPDNDKYVYMGSNFSGLTRLNLDTPSDILHFSFAGDPTSSLPGYVETNGTVATWSRLCNFSPPMLDADKNMWSFFANMDDQKHFEFRYWTASDRQNSPNAQSARPWKKLLVANNSTIPIDLLGQLIPLKASTNRNLLLFCHDSGIAVVNHNGTLENTSDDQVQTFTTLYDQDGGQVSPYGPSAFYEDPATGVVWIGNASGIYYMQPRNFLQGQGVLNRVKVARNDGTSLADYLLSGVGVNAIAVDNSDRKWFGTFGAGVIVTSSDGKTVLGEFTTTNSDIPSDNIYQLCYNPTTRSMMVSTDKGLAEFFIGGQSAADLPEDEVRVYPNPVAPDYYGWVTIDNIPDNALVKIADSQGNIVRELGRSETGSVQWDVNNLYGSRVRTGVYYVLVSSDASEGKANNVGKVLVMN